VDAAPRVGRTYYPHIEGLRGVAALYVFLYHIWQAGAQNAAGTLTQLLVAAPLMQYGHFAVAAFIVISGYCLALPVAMRPERAFGVREFFKRRARRLGPAYLLVLFLSVVPFCLAAVLQGAHISVAHIALALGLHLALIHNLFNASNEYLNGPMWSIALEVQIYVVFALLLVPVWRRFGVVAQLVVALVLGVLPHVLLHRFDWTSPWLLGLFAMGVGAAALTARPELARWPWRWLSLATALAALAALAPYRDQITPDGTILLMDLTLGLAIAVFFVAAARHETFAPARVLALRPLIVLGSFSYSLYLVHGPLVRVAGAALARAHAGTLASVLVYAALVPLVLAASYAVYRVAERPFISTFARKAIDAHEMPAAPHRVLVVETP
jgi:peptidoglycan/LPS O-acetylase OafA/YrhL